MRRRWIGSGSVLAFLVLIDASAGAHDSWISSGAFKNHANEWCCGEIDCAVVPESRVHPNGVGYELIFNNTEVVPYDEALPSMDGRYWRCQRPDGSRRCFFAPRPST